MAKYYIFINAIDQGFMPMVLFAIVMSLVGVYYYFKILIAMFLHEDTEGGKVEADSLQTLLLIVSCVGLLLLGVLPSLVYNLL